MEIDNILAMINKQWYVVITAMATALPALIVAYVAYRQLKASNDTKRAEFFHQIILNIRFDPIMAQTMYRIDYERGWYNRDFHNCRDGFERNVDKLLSYLSYICYLKRTDIISDTEFESLQFKIASVCSYDDVKTYLWNLHHYSEKYLRIKSSFDELIEFGIENEYLAKNFKENDTDLYKKYWDFETGKLL